MEVSVLKFGGRSVDTPLKMKLAREAIQKTSGRKVVVLSALSGVTNQLVQISLLWNQGKMPEIVQLVANIKVRHQIFIRELLNDKGNIDQCLGEIEAFINSLLDKVYAAHTRERERELLGFGELLSGAMFFRYLLESGLDTFHFSATEHILLDHEAEPNWTYISNSMSTMLETKSCEVFTTEGFLCRNANGGVDNLGRGGSDFTASIIGAALRCKEVQIWTDIDGIHNNDPRYVTETSSLERLTYFQAANLSLAGSKVLHPKSIMPLEFTNTPVRVISTTNRATNGTIISGNLGNHNLLACAVRDVVLMKVSGLLCDQLTYCLEEIEGETDTKMGDILELRVGGSWLEFLICDSKKRLIQTLSNRYEIELEYGWSVISIIGERLLSEKSVLSTLPGILSTLEFEILHTSSIQDRILVKVREKDKAVILNLLNKEFLLKQGSKVLQD